MLLVYTPAITSRIKYIFKHICTRILQIPVEFTTKVEVFIAHNNLKLTYANQPLGREFFIKSNPILTEKGITDISVVVQDWEDTKCFFYIGDNCSIPFDIFGASFYLLSRYEEYLPHRKDDFGRFTKHDSINFKYGFLEQPVVDIWVQKFQKALSAYFPSYKFKTPKFRTKLVIDVPAVYHYKSKGLLRTIGGTIQDLFSLKFSHIYNRFMVLFGFQKDPYDSFSWIINKQQRHKKRFEIFFLVGDYSPHDNNNSSSKKAVLSLIKSMADYCTVGLKASFKSIDNASILKMEKQRLTAITNHPLKSARVSFSKVSIPNVYRNFIALDIYADYTMGYADEIGFRAGTCTPFLFYDIDYEVQTPLVVHPYQLMDFALLKHISFLDKKEALLRAIESVKRVNGTFTAVFHNYTFGTVKRWANYKKLFDIILNSEE